MYVPRAELGIVIFIEDKKKKKFFLCSFIDSMPTEHFFQIQRLLFFPEN
jgi:hypothetical protein